jgi:hypothetical protein
MSRSHPFALAALVVLTFGSFSVAANDLKIDLPQRAVLVFTNGKQFNGELVSINSKEVKFRLNGRGAAIPYKATQLKEVQLLTDTYVYNKDKGRFESLKDARAKDRDNEPEGAITIDKVQPAFFQFANGQIVPGQLISLNSKEVRCTIGGKTASYIAGQQIKCVRVQGKNLPEDYVYNDEKKMFENAREKAAVFKDATFPQPNPPIAVVPPQPPPMPPVGTVPNPNPGFRPRPTRPPVGQPTFPQPQPQPTFPQPQPQPQPAFPQPQPYQPPPTFPVNQPQPTPPFQPQPIQPTQPQTPLQGSGSLASGGDNDRTLGIILILRVVVGLCVLGCHIIVVVNLFKTGETVAAVACLVLTLCIGPLMSLIYGWKNAADWGITGVMLCYTGLFITGIVLAVIQASMTSGAL